LEKVDNLAVLILAAGTSSRLGKPKQLVKYKNKSLIQIVVEKALAISDNVTVVLGYKATSIVEEIIDYPIAIAVNPKFYDGIASSISFGVEQIEEYDNCLIMLCDQPFIPISHYKKLIKNFEKDSLIGSKYGSFATVPAIFSKKYYPSLLKLKGDKGAKSILAKNNAPTIKLEKKDAIDIDTKEDINIYLDL